MDLVHCDALPHADELLYSYQARIRLYFAVRSPKSLIESLYENRSVAASWVYPSHLQKLVDVIPTSTKLSATKLIYQHTLFPLAAFFMPPVRRRQVEALMLSEKDTGSHVLSGYAANKLPKLQYLRYCPVCAEEQRQRYGEVFWLRSHQVPAIQFCYKHNVKLVSCTSIKKGLHRHEFIPASTCNLDTREETSYCEFDKVISIACEKLLNNTEVLISPSFAQWTNYYKQLARSHGFLKGAYVDFEPIKEKINAYWPKAILVRCRLSINNKQTSWLHSIFRKHRKSFSYLEHIVVNAALSQDKFNILECIKMAGAKSKYLRTYDSVSTFSTTSSSNEVKEDKSVWKALLKVYTPKVARRHSAAMYARLYRADRDWLLRINEEHKETRITINNRVDWCKRDLAIVKSLFNVITRIDADLSLPRATKRWLMFQLSNTSTIEKYSHKLPLASMFLSRYAESVSEYQVRRITYQLLNNRHPHITRRWFLLRASGLSEERMTSITRQFLEDLNEMLPTFDFMFPALSTAD
ncbi:TnsD family Tn7-like transposition protein [Paraglaciecola aquimarina]|uniref:TnsD family Tn7-like transposition protein n=1 Tax=Paraglaciecola aquimarina TaxID=1235557 RepID=A0ABU3SUX4_9ALTE|nr:TnsD family Tn7-like transposition protein [Paraglaciecola aquimarina]MDU0353757.1 TnsD family Tn7-like transposition protein [Paraglaciecola aquimarina]